MPEGVALPEDEAGLGIAPEDLGSHFLSEAIEQGDLSARDVAELELLLSNDSGLEPSVDMPIALEAFELRESSGVRDASGVHRRPKPPEPAADSRGRRKAPPAAKSGKTKRRKLHHVARATLRTAAGKLRGLAQKLARGRRQR
ncbi:MAG TPA: hypothetical protein VJR89_39450 [Polyangiales bacterium]|nr:hypothetical protein [Polyangiales bacterium]